MSTTSPGTQPTFLAVDLALEQIGSEQAMQDLLELLEESLMRDIPLIEHHLLQGDVKAANQVLHAMKGVVPIFCAEVLCSHVAEVEGLSKTGASDEVAHAYALLQPQLKQLLSEVTAYLGEDDADGH